TLTLTDTNGLIATAEGFVPLSFHPADAPLMRFSTTNQLNFRLHASTNEAFWSMIGNMAGIGLTNPALNLEVLGTAADPIGELHASVERFALLGTNQSVPPLGPMSLHLALNEQLL